MTFQELRIETKQALKNFIANKTEENKEIYLQTKKQRDQQRDKEVQNRINNL